MSRAVVVVSLALLAMGSAAASDSSDTSVQAVIEVRQAGFKKMGAAMKSIAAELKTDAPDLTKMTAAAQVIALGAKEQPAWFPAGSGPESGLETDALAHIWKDTAKFATLSSQLERRVGQLHNSAGQQGCRSRAHPVQSARGRVFHLPQELQGRLTMRHPLIRCLMVLALFVGTQTHAADAPIPVKMVVVANFENGKDSGDKPGEFQLWVEREQLTGHSRGSRRHAPHPAQLGGTVRPAARESGAVPARPALRLQQNVLALHRHLRVDPQLASVGSAAWARWVVNGDEMREIDDREIPAGWPYGLFAIGAMKPNTLPTDPNSFGSVESPEELGWPIR